MALLDTVFSMLHVLFAGLWTGATIFFAWRIHPLLVDGNIRVQPTMAITSGLRWLTRIGAVVFVATGAHMAATIPTYADGGLFTTSKGYAVLAMLVLWFVVTGLIEVSMGTIQDELSEGRIQTAGRESQTLVRVAATFSVVLLLLSGYLGQPLV